jgi:hypothetical protein
MNAEVDLWDTVDLVPVSGGSVTMNGTALSLINMTSYGGGKYYQLSSALGQTVPFSYSGGQLIFSATGSSSFAALADTFAYVNKDMNITSPSIYSPAISKSAGFTLTWGYNSGSTDTIMVNVYDDSSGGIIRMCSDNGSTTFTSTDLASFKTGELHISVSRMSYKYATDGSGRQYVMAAYTDEVIYGSLY